MRKHSDQTMSLELMTRRLTYSVQWWQFLPSVFLLWIAAEKLFWSRFLVFRSCQMGRHSSVVAVGRAWQAAAVHIWRGRGLGEGTGNRPDWAGHCRWAGVSSTLATWSGRSTSSCNLEWVPRWGSWPTVQYEHKTVQLCTVMTLFQTAEQGIHFRSCRSAPAFGSPRCWGPYFTYPKNIG